MILSAVLLSAFTHPWLFWFPKSLPFLKLGETIYEPNFKLSKMSAFQAGMARNWRLKLERVQRIRDRNTKMWVAAIRNVHLFSPPSGAENQEGYIRYPVKIKNAALRAILLEKSHRMGLGIMAGYPTTIAAIDELKYDFRGLRFPGAEACVQELVTLPVHVYVTETDVSRTLASICGPTQLPCRKA